MTGALARQRCFHHASREAVSRCPQCRRFYCRECVTEHAGQLLCASCLAVQNKPGGGDTFSLARLWLPVGLVGGFFLAWLFFYYLGVVLTKMPMTTHESGRP